MYVPAELEKCRSAGCSEGGCSLDLAGVAGDVEVLSVNCLKGILRHRGRVCDCAVLWKASHRIAAVELKGGQSASVKILVEQLQGGLKLLEKVLKGQVVSEFFPVLLYSGKKNPTSALANRRVSFRGQQHRIIVQPCGARLVSILPKPNPPATRQAGRGRGRR